MTPKSSRKINNRTRLRPSGMVPPESGRRTDFARQRLGKGADHPFIPLTLFPRGRDLRRAARPICAYPSSPSSRADSSRMATLRTLPVTVIGNSSTTRTYLGIL